MVFFLNVSLLSREGRFYSVGGCHKESAVPSGRKYRGAIAAIHSAVQQKYSSKSLRICIHYQNSTSGDVALSRQVLPCGHDANMRTTLKLQCKCGLDDWRKTESGPAHHQSDRQTFLEYVTTI